MELILLMYSGGERIHGGGVEEDRLGRHAHVVELRPTLEAVRVRDRKLRVGEFDAGCDKPVKVRVELAGRATAWTSARRAF